MKNITIEINPYHAAVVGKILDAFRGELNPDYLQNRTMRESIDSYSKSIAQSLTPELMTEIAQQHQIDQLIGKYPSGL